jgi:hypothetical protein
MPNPISSLRKLRKNVLAELDRLSSDQEAQRGSRYSPALGPFLLASLANLGLSRADFARSLDMEQELADAILDGILPEPEIGDELLVEISRVVKHDPNVLRLTMGRPLKPVSKIPIE